MSTPGERERDRYLRALKHNIPSFPALWTGPRPTILTREPAKVDQSLLDRARILQKSLEAGTEAEAEEEDPTEISTGTSSCLVSHFRHVRLQKGERPDVFVCSSCQDVVHPLQPSAVEENTFMYQCLAEECNANHPAKFCRHCWVRRRGELCFRDHYQALGTVKNVRGETGVRSGEQTENTGCFETLRHSVPAWFPQRLKDTPCLISCSLCGMGSLLQNGGFYSCGGACFGQGCRDSSVVFCRDCYAEVMLRTPRKFRSLVPLAYLARHGAARLLLAGAFVKFVDAGGRIGRRQDLEQSHPELFLTAPDVLLVEDVSPTRNIFVVSYPWLSREEPDPDGHTSRAVADFLRRDSSAYIFWDVACLEQPKWGGGAEGGGGEFRVGGDGGQRGRSAGEELRYGLAMSAFETIFAGQSPRLCVLRVTSVPRDAPNRRPFYTRGWCRLETALAAHKKPHQVFTIPPVDDPRNRIAPVSIPLAPELFEDVLLQGNAATAGGEGESDDEDGLVLSNTMRGGAGGSASSLPDGPGIFHRESDRKAALLIYTRFFESIAQQTNAFSLTKMRTGSAAGLSSDPFFSSAPLRSTTKVGLGASSRSPAGDPLSLHGDGPFLTRVRLYLTQLRSAQSGVFRHLEDVRFLRRCVSDGGAACISRAFAALPALKVLWMEEGPLTSTGVKQVCKAFVTRAASALGGSVGGRRVRRLSLKDVSFRGCSAVEDECCESLKSLVGVMRDPSTVNLEGTGLSSSALLDVKLQTFRMRKVVPQDVQIWDVAVSGQQTNTLGLLLDFIRNSRRGRRPYVIRRLSLRRCSVSDAAFARLIGPLLSLPSLRICDFDHNELSLKSLEALDEALDNVVAQRRERGAPRAEGVLLQRVDFHGNFEGRQREMGRERAAQIQRRIPKLEVFV